MASLRGRPLQVIELSLRSSTPYRVVLPTGQIAELPRAGSPHMITLGAYAQSGGAGDTVRALAAHVSDKLAGVLPAAQVASMRDQTMRSLKLAAPVVGAGPIMGLGPSSEPFVLALKAYAARDTQRARRLLDSLSALHADFAPGEVTMDAVYLESWLRAQIGDTLAASTALDKALRGLPAALPSILETRRLPSASAGSWRFAQNWRPRQASVHCQPRGPPRSSSYGDAVMQ